eukprot:c35214_g1_i1 orf=113-277(+)
MGKRERLEETLLFLKIFTNFVAKNWSLFFKAKVKTWPEFFDFRPSQDVYVILPL